MTFTTQCFQLVQKDIQLRTDAVSGKVLQQHTQEEHQHRTPGEEFPEKQPVYHDQKGSEDGSKNQSCKAIRVDTQMQHKPKGWEKKRVYLK